VGLVDSVIALIVAITVFAVPFRGSILLLTISTCAVSVRRAVLGHLGFGRLPLAGAGLSDGHAELVPARFPDVRVLSSPSTPCPR
jgi:hypothetical protein